MTNEALKNTNIIFTTVRSTWPAWYEKYYPSQQSERLAKRIWATGINQLTTNQVENGLQRMVLECDFPPKLKEFIALASNVKMPKELGLPDLDAAFNQALVGKFKLNKVHEVVKVAANKTGVFDLLHGAPTDSELKKRFAYNYHIIVDRFAKGESLNGEVNKALEHITISPTTGANDVLIDEAIRLQGLDKKSGYEAFLEAKRNLRGRA